MDAEFMGRLEAVRKDFAKPMILSSAYRCPAYNARVSTTGKLGPHTTGCAVDVLCHHEDALSIVLYALKHGMTGFGVKQHGLWDKRFVHVDSLPRAAGRPRPTVWSYV